MIYSDTIISNQHYMATELNYTTTVHIVLVKGQ